MSLNVISMTEALQDYITQVSPPPHPLLSELRVETSTMPSAGMQIAPMQGHFMGLLVKLISARRILEIGVFTGYSSLAMALSLPPEGEIVALDVSEEWTAVAKKYWQKAGLSDRIDLRLAPALQSMDAMIAHGEAGSFDMAFIDADKPAYPDYWDRALALVRPGGLIAVDNVLFQSAVPSHLDDAALDAHFSHVSEEKRPIMIANTHAARRFNDLVREDDRVDFCVIPVGDGITLAVKR